LNPFTCGFGKERKSELSNEERRQAIIIKDDNMDSLENKPKINRIDK
jgi:hypothetical protein